MNVQQMVVMGVAVLFSVASTLMIRYEWLRQEKEKHNFWKFPKGLWIYAGVMLVLQCVLGYALMVFYPENTLCMVIKRLGLMALIWQAAAIDWKFQKIPNNIILMGIVFRGIMIIPELILERQNVLAYLVQEGIALAVVVVLVGICLLLMKNSIGMGDLKLLMMMAIIQGLSGMVASVFLSMLISFFVSVTLLIMKKKTRKDSIPFAPCVLPGAWFGMFLTGM